MGFLQAGSGGGGRSSERDLADLGSSSVPVCVASRAANDDHPRVWTCCAISRTTTRYDLVKKKKMTDLSQSHKYRSLLFMIRNFNEKVFLDPASGYPFIGLFSLQSNGDPGKLMFAAGLECLSGTAYKKSIGISNPEPRPGGRNIPLRWDGRRASLREVEHMTAVETSLRSSLLKKCTFLAISFAYFSSKEDSGKTKYSDVKPSEERLGHRFLVLLARYSVGERWLLYVMDRPPATRSGKTEKVNYIINHLQRSLPEFDIDAADDVWLPISDPNSTSLNFCGEGICFFGPCSDLLFAGSMLRGGSFVKNGEALTRSIRQTISLVGADEFRSVSKHMILSLLLAPGKSQPRSASGSTSTVNLARNLLLVEKVAPSQWALSTSRGPSDKTKTPTRRLDLERVSVKAAEIKTSRDSGKRRRSTYKQPDFS